MHAAMSVIDALREQTASISQSVLTNALTLIVGASIGFGTSQMFIVTDVAKSKNDIGYLVAADASIRAEQIAAHASINDRINNLSTLMGEQTRLNQELVSLIKIQNELLTRDRK